MTTSTSPGDELAQISDRVDRGIESPADLHRLLEISQKLLSELEKSKTLVSELERSLLLTWQSYERVKHGF